MSDPPPAESGAPDPGPRPTGEAIPAVRRLARAPGERYRTAPPELILVRPDLWRALALGLAAGLGAALLAAMFHAVLSITAVLGGWLIGVGVRTGAWRGRPHRPSRTPLALAAALGIVTWVGGHVLSWLLSMAILPGSSRTLPERVVATPFLDWVGPQLGPLDLVSLLLLVGVAWAAAHSSAQERRTPA
jgi:hypothetical protein